MSEGPGASRELIRTPVNARSTLTSRLALSLVLAHLVFVASLGQYYAKIQIPIGGLPLYATELVLVATTILGIRAITSVPWDGITKLVVAFGVCGGAWVLLAGIGDTAGAGAKAFSFFVYSVFYFVIRGAARTDDDRWRVLRAFAIASIAGALLGLWQMQSGSPAFDAEAGIVETSTGSMRWLPGEFALYGLFGAIVVSVRAIIQRKMTLASGIVLVAAAAELILTQHRSAIVAFAVTLIATAIFLSGSTAALRGLLKLIIVAAAGLVLFTWIFGGSYLSETLLRVSATSDLSDVNIDWRLLNWYEVFDGISSKPLGHGFATWDFLFTMNDPLTGSHNSFLDLAYRIGVQGLVVFAALPVLLFQRTRRLVQRTSPNEQLLLVTVCACMLAFIVFSSFNMVLETPHMSIMFWVLLGVGSGAVGPANN